MADEQEVTLDLTGERFHPELTGGAFIEAEHQARYQFAARRWPKDTKRA
jgi:hypothetical protein